jgi:hypothetical protein
MQNAASTQAMAISCGPGRLGTFPKSVALERCQREAAQMQAILFLPDTVQERMSVVCRMP